MELRVRLTTLAAHWAMPKPVAIGALPTPEIETACDEWCRQHGKTVEGAPMPPDNLRPWLSIRAALAAAVAQSNADVREPPETHSYGELIEWLLVERWHDSLKQQWILLAARRN